MLSHSYSNKIILKGNTLFILIQVLFLSIFFIQKINSDLPVHCQRSDVVGSWTLKISKNSFTPSLTNQVQTSCGHGLPNRVVELSDDSDLNIPNYFEIKVKLNGDNKILENGVSVGTWTFVYDQSFILYYKNTIITAPFKYYSLTKISNCSKTFLGWYIPDKNNFRSNWSCFYAEKDEKSASFAEIYSKNIPNFNFLQIEVPSYNQLNNFIEKNIENPSLNNDNNDLVKNDFFIQIKNEYERNPFNLIKYEHLNNAIEKLNKLDLGWKADVHPQFIGMSLNELKHNLGLNRGMYNQKYIFEESKSFFQINNEKTDLHKADKESIDQFLSRIDTEINMITIGTKNLNIESNSIQSNNENKSFENSKNFLTNNINKADIKDTNCCVPKPEDYKEKTESKGPYTFTSSKRDKDSKNVNDYSEVSKYLNSDISHIDEETLPLNWDWRNVGGVNYVPEVRSQGNCGSCYVFSTMTTLESRLRIKTNNKDRTLFSKQFPLSCNFYSEGCDGGYPVLVAKFLQEFEVVPEDCFKYTQSTNSCSNVCDYTKFKKKYSVSRWGYLGGAYGKSSESEMVKELRARGPIPGNILVHWSFNYYKDGIFSLKALRKNIGSLNKNTLNTLGRDWAKVEHSITLVGYGEENGIKYWIGMNTWGEEWGENGFFRILRGENEAEIESMGEFMDIQYEDRY